MKLNYFKIELFYLFLGQTARGVNTKKQKNEGGFSRRVPLQLREAVVQGSRSVGDN